MFETKSDELAVAGHSIAEIAEILPQYNSTKYRAHAKYFPPIPTTLEDLTFCGPLYEQQKIAFPSIKSNFNMTVGNKT